MTAIDRLAGLAGNVAIKAPCRAATTANTTLNGLQTIDGIALAAGDRVLVWKQTDATQNGIRIADTGDWIRDVDFAGTGDCVKGTLVLVTNGATYGQTILELTTTSPVIGTSTLDFAVVGTPALAYASAFMQTVLDDLTAAAARATLGAAGLTDNNAFSGNNTHTGTITMTGKAINEAQGADIASVAGITDIGAATGNYVKVTGANTITGLGTVQAGTRRIVEFTGALVLTYNATSLILPTAANITTRAGDVYEFESEGSGNWRCTGYTRADGSALKGGQITATISGAVATGATVFPIDDTIPQITEGNEFITRAITPMNALSTLEFRVTLVVGGDGSTMGAALFQDATAGALAAMIATPVTVNAATIITFTYTMAAGTTSLTTFRVRAGCAGTTTFNGTSGNRFMGGVMCSSIVIREVLP